MKNPHAVALGRKGGQSKSPKKIAASRRNALKKVIPIVNLSPKEEVVSFISKS